MANKPDETPRRSEVGKVYARVFLLIFALFLFHVLLLFDVAGLWVSAQGELKDWVGTHGVGKTIILGSFLVLFVAHVTEAVIWALFLRWQRLVPSLSDGLHFAAVTMTTLGYGDIVLPRPWRQVGGLLAIAGVLKFGCSTAFLFLVMQTAWTRHL